MIFSNLRIRIIKRIIVIWEGNLKLVIGVKYIILNLINLFKASGRIFKKNMSKEIDLSNIAI